MVTWTLLRSESAGGRQTDFPRSVFRKCRIVGACGSRIGPRKGRMGGRRKSRGSLSLYPLNAITLRNQVECRIAGAVRGLQKCISWYLTLDGREVLAGSWICWRVCTALHDSHEAAFVLLTLRSVVRNSRTDWNRHIPRRLMLCPYCLKTEANSRDHISLNFLGVRLG